MVPHIILAQHVRTRGRVRHHPRKYRGGPPPVVSARLDNGHSRILWEQVLAPHLHAPGRPGVVLSHRSDANHLRRFRRTCWERFANSCDVE